MCANIQRKQKEQGRIRRTPCHRGGDEEADKLANEWWDIRRPRLPKTYPNISNNFSVKIK